MKITKVWIKSFGRKEYMYFDTISEASNIVEDARMVNDDPFCCGVCE